MFNIVVAKVLNCKTRLLIISLYSIGTITKKYKYSILINKLKLDFKLRITVL